MGETVSQGRPHRPRMARCCTETRRFAAKREAPVGNSLSIGWMIHFGFCDQIWTHNFNLSHVSVSHEDIIQLKPFNSRNVQFTDKNMLKANIFPENDTITCYNYIKVFPETDTIMCYNCINGWSPYQPRNDKLDLACFFLRLVSTGWLRLIHVPE